MAEREEEKSYSLKLSVQWRLFYTFVAVVGLVAAFACLEFLIQGWQKGKALSLLIAFLGVISFGGGALFLFLLIRTSLGEVRISSESVIIDTYIAVGRIEAHNFEKVEKIGCMGMSCLAFEVKNLDDFLASASGEEFAAQGKYTLQQQILGSLMASHVLLPSWWVNPFLTLAGLTKLPPSPDERDLLEWNYENYQYHILLPLLWLPRWREMMVAMEETLHQSSSDNQKKSRASQSLTKHS